MPRRLHRRAWRRRWRRRGRNWRRRRRTWPPLPKRSRGLPRRWFRPWRFAGPLGCVGGRFGGCGAASALSPLPLLNTSGGRCEACEGQGVKRIEMSFLPDVRVPCEVCNGARFNAETLAVTFKGEIDRRSARNERRRGDRFFRPTPRSKICVKILQDVGLGYLTLGQQSPTLSGGEAQRTGRWLRSSRKYALITNDASGAAGRAARSSTRCTCSTSPRWACTWPTWKS